MNQVEVLERGAGELAEVLPGFDFTVTGSGPSSGGPFASGEYRREDRRLKLHVRDSLGLVAYHVGEQSLAHEDLVRAVRAVRGVAGEPEYPGFSQNVLEAFRHLRADLERFGSVFVSGSIDDFRALKRWAEDHPKAKGFAAPP